MVIHIASKTVDEMVRKLAAKRGLTLGATVICAWTPPLKGIFWPLPKSSKTYQPALELATPDRTS